MTRVLAFFVVSFLCLAAEVKAQKQKKAETPKAVSLQPYSYLGMTIINGSSSSFTGCFVQIKDSTYFVTSRNHFFTPINEARKPSSIFIYLDSNTQQNFSQVLSLNMNTQRIVPVCFDSICTSIVLLPISVPKTMFIRYAELNSTEALTNKDMMIVGYVNDSANIINTKFKGFFPGDKNIFFTELSNTKDQTGSPVFMASGSKNVRKWWLAGIYAGRELSKDHFNNGQVVPANLIVQFLEKKKVVPPVKSTKSKIIRKKRM